MIMAMICSLSAYAQYTFELVKPPGAANASTFGINNAGQVVGNASDSDLNFLFSFEYDMKRGVYTTISDEFAAMEISNTGIMVGNPAFDLNVCAIRDKQGIVTPFYPPSNTEGTFCDARGVNPDGKVAGFVGEDFGTWRGFIYDSEYGTFEEFLPSPQTIAQGINAQGQNVGSIYLFDDQAYPGSPEGRYGYLRQPDGFVKYFNIAQSLPGASRARGISENGLMTGWYEDPLTFAYTGFVAPLPDSPDFETIWLTDEQVLNRDLCDPDLVIPPGFVYFFSDFTAQQIRNDGVVVGLCADFLYNFDTDEFLYPQFGFIATPEK